MRQLHSWDCGLACVLMVLRAIGRDQDMSLQALIQLHCSLARTSSVWSIDLCYLLRRLGVECTLLTIIAGANPSYACEKFYQNVSMTIGVLQWKYL